MALTDQLGLGGGGGGPPMDEAPPAEGKSDHYKGIAGRLKGALDAGNDARVKQILRDCIEEVLGEE